MFSKLTLIFAVASVMASSVLAAPQYGYSAPAHKSGPSGSSSSQSGCGNNQIQSCCNTSDAGRGGLFPSQLTSANCIPATVVGGSLEQTCNADQSAACCPVGNNNEMLVNAQCSSLNI